MTKIKKIRLSDSAIDAIMEMIVEKGFKPGDKFYSENELAKQLGVSRSSIREAVKILETTGLVNVSQGKGVFYCRSTESAFQTVQHLVEKQRAGNTGQF